MVKATWILTGLLLLAAAANDVAPAAETGNKTDTSEPVGPAAVAALRARGPAGLAEAVRMYDLAVANRARLSLMCRAVPPEEKAQLDRDVAAWRAAVQSPIAL